MTNKELYEIIGQEHNLLQTVIEIEATVFWTHIPNVWRQETKDIAFWEDGRQEQERTPT